MDSVQTIVDTAISAADPTELDAGSIYAWMSPQGQLHKVDLTGDEYRQVPRMKKGTVHVEDLDSFITYWTKHHDEDSELYVNVGRRTITAILDAHTDDDWEDGARWGQHRLILQLATSQRWNDWTNADKKAMPQRAWAEFIEEHLDDIRDPDAATMLEIAQTFQTSSKVKFGSAVILSNGDRKLSWDEHTDASAGRSGQLTVPASFTIGIAPFDFSDAFELTARFRYRVEQQALSVAYLLNDPDAILRDAVLDVVKDLEARLNADRNSAIEAAVQDVIAEQEQEDTTPEAAFPDAVLGAVKQVVDRLTEGRSEDDTTPPVKVMRGTPA